MTWTAAQLHGHDLPEHQRRAFRAYLIGALAGSLPVETVEECRRVALEHVTRDPLVAVEAADVTQGEFVGGAR